MFVNFVNFSLQFSFCFLFVFFLCFYFFQSVCCNSISVLQGMFVIVLSVTCFGFRQVVTGSNFMFSSCSGIFLVFSYYFCCYDVVYYEFFVSIVQYSGVFVVILVFEFGVGYYQFVPNTKSLLIVANSCVEVSLSLLYNCFLQFIVKNILFRSIFWSIC